MRSYKSAFKTIKALLKQIRHGGWLIYNNLRLGARDLNSFKQIELYMFKWIYLLNWLQNTCGNKSRPDFLFDCFGFHIIVEVDEDGHRSYIPECEIARMNNISMDLPYPSKFIRYNPDNNKYGKEHKHKVLLNTVCDYITRETLDNIEPIFLFFD